MTSEDAEDVALFRRVSTDQQDVLNQEKALDEHVARGGHEGPAGSYHVVKVIDLPDTSASKEHPRHLAALEEVIGDVKAGLYRKLIVWDASRLDRRSRNHAELFRLRVWDVGGTVESVREPMYGRDDLAGDVITSGAQRSAADYSAKLKADVKNANAKIDERRGYRGGRAPFGFMSVCSACGMIQRDGQKCIHRGTKRMQPDPALVRIIIELFERIAGGLPVPVVGAWLLEVHGIARKARRPRKGDRPRASTEPLPLPNSTITATIRRPVYWTGRYQVTDWNGVVREHKTEPIISPELWQAANASLDSRPSTNAKPRRPRREDYSAALFCGGCYGPAYRTFHHGKIDPSGERYPSGRPKRLERRVYYCKVCKGMTWDADRADEQVEQLMSQDDTPEYEMIWIPGSNHAAELERLRQELRDLGGRGLDDEEEDAERERLRAERAMLAALPVIPPKRALHATGRTMGQAWDAWTHAERINYLRGEVIALDLTGHGEGVRVEREYLDTSEPEEDVWRVSDHVHGHFMTNGAYVWDELAGHRGLSPEVSGDTCDAIWHIRPV